MAADTPLSEQIEATIEVLRTELVARVATLKAMQEILDACKAQEDAGWHVDSIDDLFRNADNEVTRAGIAAAFSVIEQNIEASAQG